MLSQRMRGRWLWAVLVLAAGAAAFVSTEWRAAYRLADRLPATLEGSDLWLTGVVADLPRVGPNGTRFVFEPEAASLGGLPVRVPRRLSLGWYREPGDEQVFAGTEPELRAGQRWRLMARLQQPHGAFNPHGFDYELYLFERGIGATGSVRLRPKTLPRLLDAAAGHPLQRLRQSLRDGIRSRVS
ncbi:MAG: DUF4131 domain-containing protein, partial [Pseudomonadota bacterium]|nr:DUF4131 domain-containing protein [Pseudomonadota bacterium]